ncbi:MAG: PAS domain-containing protein [Janthinobacterium lividum]
MEDAVNIFDALMGNEDQDSTSRIAVRILESITDAFFALDSEWRFTYVNSEAERVLFRTRASLLGKNIWEQFPEAIGSTFEREYRRVAVEQVTVAFEEFFPPLSAWFEVRGFPSQNGISVFFHDITEQIQRRQRERFLAELAERARRLTDPEEVIADAVNSLGVFLGVSRCVFVDIDVEADRGTSQPDYRADDSVVSMAGVFPISAFGATVVAAYAAGRTVVVDDVRADRDQVPAESIAAYEAVGIRAHASVPVVHSDRLVSCIGAHSSVPRHWKPEEIELLQTVVERTWLMVEVIRQEHALMREAEERREAHERMASTLERIADAFFALDRQFRFTYVNAQAERVLFRTREELLGQNIWDAFPDGSGSTFDQEYRRALSNGVPVTFEEFYPPLSTWFEVRAYPSTDGLSVFFQNVTERRRGEEALRQSEERYRLLLESTGDGIYGIDLQGRFTFVNHAAARMLGFAQAQLIGRSGHVLIHHTHSDGTHYPENECPIYHALRSGESAHVEDDVFWRTDGTSFPVAYSAAPILEDGTVRGGVVTFSDISERKALDKERERLAERERNIAAQLQAALTPAVPEHIPGMSLTKYYEAALDEAGVGGDFYDVFPIDKGCTALIVGDLSGKGLAAATQVATVRNMLRAFLYRAQTLSGALDGLNRLLAEQGLLTGFATLFVGCYDSGAGTLSYVNCGQEPALVRQSAGGIEFLAPTGPVLGSFEGAAFDEQTISLNPGDILAVFTDGLTEVGKTRREMLGVEGVAALLQEFVVPAEADSAASIAEHLTSALIAGVDAVAASGVTRDDVCLLVGVVE